MDHLACQPLVSIIVPMYGVERYIERCAFSLFVQTYPSIEFIFVDDGSPDATVLVLRALLSRQDLSLRARVQIISKENGGLPAARKTGLDAASGEFVMHVDSDDWVEPDAVEKLVHAALETESDMVVFDFWKEYAHHRKLDREKDNSIADPALFRKRLYSYASYGYVWNKFCRRSLFDGIFVPHYAMHEDIVFSTQTIYRANRIIHLREALYHYDRSNTASTTRVAKARRRSYSSRNLLDMYLYYRGYSSSPVTGVEEDILLRAAWVGFTLDRQLFFDYPDLWEKTLRVTIKPGRALSLPRQGILKLFLNFGCYFK